MALFGNVEIIKERVKIVTKEMIKNRNCKICILPDSVEIIDEKAFFQCKKLKKLIFVDEEGKKVNNKIVTIKNFAFADTKIRKFTYSHYLHHVGEYAFSNTPLSVFQYQDDNMESELVYIGDAFQQTKMDHMVVPPSVKKIRITLSFISLLCKDKDGNIVQKCTSFLEDGNRDFYYKNVCKNLIETSLIGDSISNIQRMIAVSPNLKTIYISTNQLDGKSNLEMTGKNIHFILCGDTDVLDGFIKEPEYNSIVVTFQGKAKEIKSVFLNGLANEKLVIPEGVEVIEGIPNNLRNLKELVLPSTLQKISNPFTINENLKTHVMTVSIYANIQAESYKNLCSYLDSSSTIIINGNHFTEEQKEWFRKLSPANLKLKFVEKKELTLESFPSKMEEKKEIVNSPGKIVKPSAYQKRVDDVKEEILNLMKLLPDDLKEEVQKLYNQIIEDYYENRKLEKKNLLQKQTLLGTLDSSSNLYTRLALLQNKILLNHESIARLKEVMDYRNLLNDIVEEKNDSTESIPKIIQNIKFELLKFPSIYQNFIYELADKIFSRTEEKYQVNLKRDFEKPSLSLETENTPMEEMKKDFAKLLKGLEIQELQEFIFLENAFDQESEDMNIDSLSDHIKTMNRAMKGIASKLKREEWEHLKENYRTLFSQEVLKVIEDTERNNLNRLHELETKFRNELKGFVDRAIITLNQERYFVKKLEEIKNSVLVFRDGREIKEEVKDTISSLLVKEIIEEASHIDHLDELYNLQEKIVSEVNKIYEKLNREDNIESIDKIMKQFYKDLTDIWEEVYSISFYQNSEIKINKI